MLFEFSSVNDSQLPVALTKEERMQVDTTLVGDGTSVSVPGLECDKCSTPAVNTDAISINYGNGHIATIQSGLDQLESEIGP